MGRFFDYRFKTGGWLTILSIEQSIKKSLEEKS